MKKLNHPCIVHLYEVIDDPNSEKLYLIMEYLPGGPCLKKGSPALSEEQSRVYMRDIIMGLEYCHDNGIIHHDLKPDNILIGSDSKLRICDFGVSIIYGVDDHSTLIRGTPPFLAPEVVTKTSQSPPYAAKPVDIWAAGITLYMFLFEKPPFRGKTIPETFKAIATQTLKVPYRLSNELTHFLFRILDKNPTTRLTINHTKAHPWLTQYGHDPFPDKYSLIEVSDNDLNRAITRILPLRMVIDLKVLIHKHQRRKLSLSNISQSSTNNYDSTPQRSPMSSFAVTSLGNDNNNDIFSPSSPLGFNPNINNQLSLQDHLPQHQHQQAQQANKPNNQRSLSRPGSIRQEGSSQLPDDAQAYNDEDYLNALPSARSTFDMRSRANSRATNGVQNLISPEPTDRDRDLDNIRNILKSNKAISDRQLIKDRRHSVDFQAGFGIENNQDADYSNVQNIGMVQSNENSPKQRHGFKPDRQFLEFIDQLQQNNGEPRNPIMSRLLGQNSVNSQLQSVQQNSKPLTQPNTVPLANAKQMAMMGMVPIAQTAPLGVSNSSESNSSVLGQRKKAPGSSLAQTTSQQQQQSIQQSVSQHSTSQSSQSSEQDPFQTSPIESFQQSPQNDSQLSPSQLNLNQSPFGGEITKIESLGDAEKDNNSENEDLGFELGKDEEKRLQSIQNQGISQKSTRLAQARQRRYSICMGDLKLSQSQAQLVLYKKPAKEEEARLAVEAAFNALKELQEKNAQEQMDNQQQY
ncbi:MAG: putative calcium/calmodulin-dependent protein kinase kinase 2, partial [Streblomastix strix]